MFFNLSFETDQEDNLATRFDKAMLNLKSYLKSGKSKETFQSTKNGQTKLVDTRLQFSKL